MCSRVMLVTLQSALCSDVMPLGRIVIGLFGDTAPGTTATFSSLLEKGVMRHRANMKPRNIEIFHPSKKS